MNKITINTNEGRFYYDSDSGQRLEDHIARRLASKQGKTCWWRVKDEGRCDTSRYFSVPIGTPQNGGLSNPRTLYFSIPFTEYAKIERVEAEEIKGRVHEIDEGDDTHCFESTEKGQLGWYDEICESIRSVGFKKTWIDFNLDISPFKSRLIESLLEEEVIDARDLQNMPKSRGQHPGRGQWGWYDQICERVMEVGFDQTWIDFNLDNAPFNTNLIESILEELEEEED